MSSLPTRTFVADWSGGVSVSTAYTSEVVVSESGAEQRRSLSQYPLRSFTFRATGTSGFSAHGLRELAVDLADGQRVLPLYSDYFTVTQEVPLGGFNVEVDTVDNARIYDGSTVILAVRIKPDEWKCFVTTVSGMSPGIVGIDDAVPFAIPVGSRVYAAVTVMPTDSASISPVTTRHATGTITCIEATGSTQIPPLSEPGTAPSGESSFAGYPIFPFEPDWRSVAVSSQREREVSQVGLGVVVVEFGDRPREPLSASYTTIVRAQAMRLISFFDSRAGRTFPFWIGHPVEEGIVVSASGTTVSITGDGRPYQEYERLINRHILFRLRDGSRVVKRVSSVTTGGGTINLTIASTIGGAFSASDIVSLRRCSLVRFASDSLTENWITTTACQFDLEFSELYVAIGTDTELGADDVDITDPVGTGEPLEPWQPLPPCESVLQVAAYAAPCDSCDSHRPPIKCADVRFPRSIRVRYRPEMFADADWTGTVASGTSISDAIAALRGLHTLFFDVNTDESQTIAFIGSTTGQRFKINWNVLAAGSYLTTATVTFSSVPATLRTNVKNALDTLITSSLGGTNHVTVSGDGTTASPLVVTFNGTTVSGVPMKIMQVTADVLSGVPILGSTVIKRKATGVSPGSPGTTGRHWHHTRLKHPGPAWTCAGDSTVPVSRKLWRRKINYTSNGQSFVLELLAACEVSTDASKGARGYLFNVYAFTNQLSPSYVEGASFTWSGKPATTFTRPDPCVLKFNSGAYTRLCHPQLLLCASVPTTCQSPCGSTRHAPDLSSSDISQAIGPYGSTWFDARDEFCDAITPGLPWLRTGEVFRILNFADSAARGLSLVGDASISSAALVLTKSKGQQRGAAWWSRTVSSTAIDTTFTFRVTDIRGSGSDGIALVMHSNGPGVIGAYGGGMGYARNPYYGTPGINGGVAVEIDLFDNDGAWDDFDSGQHVSVQVKDGTGYISPEESASIGHAIVSGNLSDGQPHSCRVLVASGRLKVWIDGAQLIDIAYTATDANRVGGSTCTIGLTAATGGEFGSEKHEILSWTLAGSDTSAENATHAHSNTVFGWSSPTSFDAAPVTLGGGCPTSFVPEYLCCEDEPGLMALRVYRPGWDVRAGGLTFESSLSIELCDPEHPFQSCCADPSSVGGTVECIKVQNTDLSYSCCLPIGEPIDVTIGQVVQQETDSFGATADVVVTRARFYFQITRTLVFYPSTCSYSIDGSGETSIRWEFREPDPDHVSLSYEDATINSSTIASYSDLAGATVYSAYPPSFVVASAPSDGALLEVSSLSSASEGRVYAQLGGAAALKQHLLFARFVYRALFDPVNQALVISRRNPDTSYTILGARGGLSMLPGDTISLTCVGSRITASVNDRPDSPSPSTFSLSVDDCSELGAGEWGVGGEVDASFIGVGFDDLSPPYITSYVQNDETGWSISIHERSMPGYGGAYDDFCTGCCTSPRTFCTRTRSEVYPRGFTASQAFPSDEVFVCPPGSIVMNPNPCGTGYSRGPMDLDTGTLETPLSSQSPAAVIYLAKVRARSNEFCLPSTDTRCRGFDVVYVICNDPDEGTQKTEKILSETEIDRQRNDYSSTYTGGVSSGEVLGTGGGAE